MPGIRSPYAARQSRAVKGHGIGPNPSVRVGVAMRAARRVADLASAWICADKPCPEICLYKLANRSSGSIGAQFHPIHVGKGSENPSVRNSMRAAEAAAVPPDTLTACCYYSPDEESYAAHDAPGD